MKTIYKRTKLMVLVLLCTILGSNVQAQSYAWAESFGDSNNDYSYGIATDASGNVYITGIFSSTVDFDPNAGTENLTSNGGNDVFILKLDASGNYVWAKNIGGTGGEGVGDITLDASGNIYIAGEFSGTVDFDPNAGTENLTSNSGSDVFILKLDTDGNYIWAKNFEGTSGGGISDIAVDASGNVYTTGYFFSTVDSDPNAGAENLTSNGN